MATVTAAAIYTEPPYAPSLAVLPDPKPRFAIFSSFLIHSGFLFFLPALLAFWPKPPVPVHQDVEFISLRTVEPISLPRLPRLLSSGSSSGGEGATPKQASAKPGPKLPAPVAKPGPVKPAEAEYAGLIEIHSKIPHATNRVQTILRPDLVNAPKLKFPVRVPTMVLVPKPAAPVLAAQPQKKIAETPPPPVPVVAEVPLEKPALPMPAEPPHPAGPEPEPAAKQAVTKPEPTPALPDATALDPKTAVVVNAITVPDTGAKIPDAEIAGNFSVVPSKTTAAESGEAGSGGSTAGKASGAGDSGKAGSSGGGSGTAAGIGPGVEIGGPGKGGTGIGARGAGPAGNRGNGIGIGPGTKPGPGTGSTSGPGAGGGIPGISIMGGSGNAGHIHPSLVHPRPGYELTIVSGGSSGGASRDVGVFARNETVYTVYIPMSDMGGPDWSMQYALQASDGPSDALLTPPVAVKKIAAVFEDPTASMRSNIFISATIDESGAIHGLRSVRGDAQSSKVAMDALSQWQFLPAQLGPKPVAAKVLIGVVISPKR